MKQKGTPESRRAAVNRFRKKHPERVAAHQKKSREAWKLRDPTGYERYRKTTDLKRKGLTFEKFTGMVAAQRGCCAICGIRFEDTEKGVPHVDHNHVCCPQNEACPRCLRALLCSKCNTGLGQFQDDPGLLETAAYYLRAFPLPR